MYKRRGYDIVLLAYTMTLLSMLAFLYKSYSILNYIRYLYVAFMVVITITGKKIYKSKQVFLIIGTLLAHTVIFGFLIKSNTAPKYAIIDNCKEVIVLLVFVFTTAQYVYRRQLEKEFLLVSQFCISLFLDFCYLRHFNGIAPLKFIGGVFGTSDRIRFSFGLGASNRTAYLALASVIMIIMVLKGKSWIKVGKRLDFYKLFLIISFFIGILVILSTQTRGAILSVIVFLVGYSLIDSPKIHRFIRNHGTYSIQLGVSVLLMSVFAGYAYYVFQLSGSRATYLGRNWDIFKEAGNHWTGLGYVPFSAFLSDTMGLGTTALDSYFIYIICTTGIIGGIIVFSVLIYQLLYFIKVYFSGNTNSIVNASIVIYLVLLFIGFSETIVIAPWVPHNYVFWILFLLVLMNAIHVQHRIGVSR